MTGKDTCAAIEAIIPRRILTLVETADLPRLLACA
jgi:hypothetical protein